MKLTLNMLVVMAAVSAFAITKEEYAKLSDKEKQEAFLRSTGGMILGRGSFRGKIALVDVQKECPEKEWRTLAEELVGITSYNAVYTKGSAELSKVPALKLGEAALKESGANLAVVLTASAELPPMLVAPEARWAIVNVDALKKDLPDGKLRDVMFNARCRKEAMRAYSIVCGGSGSQYQGTIVNASTPEELDKLDETIPLDNILAYGKYLAKLGVTKRTMVTYRQAYRQGWAPAPTNDYQRECISRIEASKKKTAETPKKK